MNGAVDDMRSIINVLNNVILVERVIHQIDDDGDVMSSDIHKAVPYFVSIGTSR